MSSLTKAKASSISVFAGLGSPALFSASTQATALADATHPEAQALLNSCHNIFHTELSASALDSEVDIGIALEDFPQPQALLSPPSRYHKNAVIQNTTLNLSQLLRFLVHSVKPLDTDPIERSGVAGICTGLLAAVAAAAYGDTLQFLSYGQEAFRLSLLLGIHIEQHTREVLRSKRFEKDLPWSVIVDGIKFEQAEEIILRHEQKFPKTHIFVSARSSEQCLTLSGHGHDLRNFCRESLPKNCRVRPTNIYSTYHDAKTLGPVKARILHDSARRGISFPSFADLGVPLYCGKSMADSQATKQQSLLEYVLELILIRPVDWYSAQKQIFSALAHSRQSSSPPIHVLNFGPGYGVSRAHGDANVQVEDVSTDSEASNPLKGSTPKSDDDVAIIGMAVDLPGAPDTVGLWRVLADKVNAVSEIPESRFHIEDFQDTSGNPHNPKRTLGTKFGNFIDDPFQFDNSFFGISPREAKSIDPQQRVILQTTYKALEDAGYVPDATPSFAKEAFGCYIGNATLDYPDNLKNDIDVYYSPGTLRAFLSGRLSYMFGFSGPSMTVDTACSSSMVSIYQACRALASGDCRAAVAGGVNVITGPDMYLGLDRAHFLSHTGQCKAFDESADGYCRSEGCGVFVLKKLSDALAESDSILGIIKGVEVNQSGNAHSITHPHAPTQELLFDRLFSKADIDPLRISVVEAHGTGTQAGDPEESASIRNVLCKTRDENNPLYLTSIKANIGHCEAASGAAALAKLLLMTRNHTIPAQISLQNLNPRITALGVDGATIARETTEWTSTDGQPRLSMLNNFGAAGSNGALILEEHQPGVPTLDDGTELRESYVFGFSAKSRSALVAYRKIVASYLMENSKTLCLRDVCYTSTARRQIYNYRASVCASSLVDLAKKVQDVTPIDVKKSVGDGQPNAIFLFSGQGSQYMAMGRGLFTTSPTFRQTVLDCDIMLTEAGFPSCLEVINAGPTSTSNLERSDQIQALQTSIFVLEVALARMWLEWGMQPAVVAGHSVGQYAALVIARVLELPHALILVASRARLMIERCPLDATGMLAVNAGADHIGEMIEKNTRYEELSLSCRNGPQDCVVGGPLEPLIALKEDLKERGECKSTLLQNPIAYHTSAMEAILQPLTELARNVTWSRPKTPVVCNVLGRVVAKGEDAFTADFPARHCRQTVLFEQGIKDLMLNHLELCAKEATWIEIGPHPSLLPMVKSQTQAVSNSCIASMRKSADPWLTLSDALSQLYFSRYPIRWRETFNGFPMPQCVSLPNYQFDYANFHIEYPRENGTMADMDPSMQSLSTGYNFLANSVRVPPSSDAQELVFETPINILAEFIKGHTVCNYALCPASVYHEMALAAAELFKVSRSGKKDIKEAITVEGLIDVTYLNPLIYHDDSGRTVRTTINLQNGDDDSVKGFTVVSYGVSDSKAVTVHCHGLVKSISKIDAKHKLSKLRAQIDKKKPHITDTAANGLAEVFHTKAIYEKLFPRVVTYSKMYQAIQSISIGHNCTEALAVVRISKSELTNGASFAGDPIFMDILLHAAGFVANLSVKNEDACICKEVKSARIYNHRPNFDQSFEVYCSNLDIAEENAVIANAYAISSEGEIIAVFKGMHFTRVKLAKIEAHFKNTVSKQTKRSNTPGHTSQSIKNDSRKPAAEPLNSNVRPVGQRPELPKNVPKTIDVKAIVAEVCGAELMVVTSDKELEALGVDSLMILELETRIRKASMASFTSDQLTACVTVGDIDQILSCNDADPVSRNSTIPAPTACVSNSDRGEVSQLRPSASSVIAETCGAEEASLSAETELDVLGIDSLMIIELEERLKTAFGPGINTTALATCKSVRNVTDLVGLDGIPVRVESNSSFLEIPAMRLPSADSSSSSSGLALSTPPTPFGPSGNSTDTIKDLSKRLKIEKSLSLIQSGPTVGASLPLVLFHDGSGLDRKYHNIKPLTRELWGLSNPNFFKEIDWESLSSMASAYAKTISANIEATSILGGWSFGGVVAFETTRILLAKGYPVKGVILIDSPPPLDHQALPKEIIDAVTKVRTATADQPTTVVRDTVRKQFMSNTALLSDFKPDRKGISPAIVLLRCTEGFDASGIECPGHEWLEDRSDVRNTVAGWEQIVEEEIKVIDIPGNHFEVFDKDNIHEVSKAISKACEHLEAMH